MITYDELKSILNQENNHFLDIISCIIYYIHDRKGVEVKIIPPDNPISLAFMNKAYEVVLKWYLPLINIKNKEV